MSSSNMILLEDDMKTLLNYHVSPEDTEKFRSSYESQLASGEVDIDTKFQYAFCLTHSKSHQDLKIASQLFEDLFKDGTEDIKRHSLFYLALSETKQKNYCTAKKYIKAFLTVEPSNVQAEQLKHYIEKHLKKDGVTGMALVGAAALFGGATAIVVGTMVIGSALGFAFRSRK